MKKIITLSLICLLILTGCGTTPKLKNGEEAIITFEKGKEKHQISANDLFEELKANFGLEATLKMIDNYILTTEFKDYLPTAKNNARAHINAMIESYGSRDKLLNDIVSQTNFTSIEAYEEYVYLGLLQSHAIEEYAKKQITEKEINNYYKNSIKGDIEVYHLLITPKVTDKMTKEEKEKEEKEAYKKAENIIKKINKAKNKLEEFKKLVKEYSDDKATSNKDGNLGFINYNLINKNYNDLLDEAYKLKDNEYSKKIVKTEYGYHIIYRHASKPKKDLKEIKNDIINHLSNEKIQKDASISLDGIKYYRKLYNLKIKDSTLNRQYGIYLNNLDNKILQQQ